MPSITMSDSSSIGGIRFEWDKIKHSFEPETKDLPEEDRKFFESKVKLLIGKEIKMSNIPREKIYMYIKRLDWVIKLMLYPQLFSRDRVRYEIVQLLFRLGVQISVDGLGWKYGPMGFQYQKQHVKQELIGYPKEE